MPRTFLAIPLDASTQAKITVLVQQLQLVYDSKHLKWIPLENLHLTLRFLGNVTEEQLRELSVLLRQALATTTVFDCNFLKVILFPSAQHPRLIALDLMPNKALKDLFDTIECTVVAIGVEADTRAFRPHLSLARIKGKFRLKNKPPEFLFAESLRVDKILLLQSITDPQGAIYSLLEQIPFVEAHHSQ